ncbi:MAG: DUF1127 domain-containing protein [Alphaproteobacteria bacterium]|nr:DUF1127 domain-containing protein [Alphaproteobacteria bacterium]
MRPAALPERISPLAILMRAVNLLLVWQDRARDRQQLAAMSDRALRDVGLSRADIDREASKPFWTA